MKTAAKIICVIAVVALSVMPTTAVAMRSSPDAEFERAMKKGAQARLEIRVVDDEGAPVSNATVKVLFNMLTPGGGEIVTVTTDTNGVAVAEGKTNDAIRYRVEKEGYYKSEEGMDMYNMSHRYDVKGGRWQPWGMQKEIVLRPIKNPVAIRTPVDWRWTREANQWIGFDLEKSAFVSPYGDGQTTDFEIYFEWDGGLGRKYSGVVKKIRFPQKFSGGYYEDVCSFSSFKGAYSANPEAEYVTQFEFYEKELRDPNTGIVKKRDFKGFDPGKVLVVHSRCKTDDQGNLTSARYFQMSNLQFSCGEKGVALRCGIVYNPVENDTNLEPK